MAQVTLGDNALETIGELPAVGSKAPDFSLTKPDLSEISLADYKGSTLVLNIFPSVDTPTCANSVREFNKKAAEKSGVKVLCISADLPFALARFCGAEGIENVETASTFRSTFGEDYQVKFTKGVLTGLMSRAVLVLDGEGIVKYAEQVAEVSNEPNYDAALSAL